MEDHFDFSNVLDREAAVLPIRHFVLSLPLVVFATVPSLAADPPAIAALKEKGLTRSGRFFVIEAEDAVVEKWKATRVAVADCLATAGRKDEADRVARELADLEDRRAALQEDLNELNQQINEQSFQPMGNNGPGGFGRAAYISQLTARRNMIRMNLAEIASMQKSAKADLGTDRKALEEDGKKSQEAAKAALKAMRDSVDAVMKQYDQLNADASVIAALRTWRRTRRVPSSSALRLRSRRP